MQNHISDSFPLDFEVKCNSNMFFFCSEKYIYCFLIVSIKAHFVWINMQRRIISTSKKFICMRLILLMSLRLPAVRVDRTLPATVCGVFLITRDNGTVFFLFPFQSAVSSNQTCNIKGFKLGNKYMHSLDGKGHLLFQMNTVQKAKGEDNVEVVHLSDP